MSVRIDATLPVSGPLRPWITDIGVGAVDADGVSVHLPDTAAALVYRPTPAGRDDLMVLGPSTRATYFAAKRVPFSLRFRIRPGRAGALLGVPVNELVDTCVPLSGLWGTSGDRLERELADLGANPESVAARVEAALLARLAERVPRDLSRTVLLQAAAESLHTPEPVPSIARRLSISERQLRNLFAGGVGVSPKRFARIERVRKVLSLASDGSWAALAATAGYYDQSHMTADFHDVMGVPPGAYAAGRLPAARPCGLPASAS
ncbi:helix-turn-helix domain-containing protein [Nonomuraea sp. NPDC046570]|uniref:helix-turn-helix domain-containing protein n=1 Tax=Nonomuraea sp. NPDC046570 TaxID=3155255 RepID=UPI0033FDB234